MSCADVTHRIRAGTTPENAVDYSYETLVDPLYLSTHNKLDWCVVIADRSATNRLSSGHGFAYGRQAVPMPPRSFRCSPLFLAFSEKVANMS